MTVADPHNVSVERLLMNVGSILESDRFLHLTKHSDGKFTLRLKNLDGTVAIMADSDAERLLLTFLKLVQLESKSP